MRRTDFPPPAPTVSTDDFHQPPPTAAEFAELLRRVALLEDQVAALRDSIAREHHDRGRSGW